MWTKIFILALSNLKHGKLKLSIDENHHFITGKFPGPTANLKIEDKDKPIRAANTQKVVCAFDELILLIPKLM